MSTEKQLVRYKAFDCFVSSKLFKELRDTEETPGDFTFPLLYINHLTSHHKVAVTSMNLTKGFYNVCDDVQVQWLSSSDDKHFSIEGSSMIKAGYYGSVADLISEINVTMYNLYHTMIEKCHKIPIKAIPLLLQNDDGYVIISEGEFIHPASLQKIKSYINLAPSLSEMLGCSANGDCGKRIYRDFLRLDTFNSMDVSLYKKPNLTPPYRKIFLYSNLSSKPLLEINIKDMNNWHTIFASPKFIDIESLPLKKLHFYFKNEFNQHIKKQNGDVSFTLSFKE